MDESFGQYAAAVALFCRREVAVAQLVELRVVVPVVAGSSPVRHPPVQRRQAP